MNMSGQKIRSMNVVNTMYVLTYLLKLCPSCLSSSVVRKNVKSIDLPALFVL